MDFAIPSFVHFLYPIFIIVILFAFLRTPRLLACLDIYPNIDRISKTKCPVMVIHGRLDEEVSIEHGVELHQAVPTDLKREPWWVPDRGHNDITEGPGKLAEYVGRLRNYFATLD